MPKWEAAWVDRGNVLSTGLVSLASGARTNSGTEIANQTNLDEVGKVKLSVTFASGPAAGARVDIFMLTSPDSDGYEDGASGVDPGNHTLVASIPVRGITTAQVLMSNVFGLQPAPTKFILSNQTTATFPTGGSTVKLYTANK